MSDTRDGLTPEQYLERMQLDAIRALRDEPIGDDADRRAAGTARALSLLKGELNSRRVGMKIMLDIAEHVVRLCETPGPCPFRCGDGIDGHADECPIVLARWAVQHYRSTLNDAT